PDGKLPSPRWRWYSRITLVVIGITLVGMAAHSGRVEHVKGTTNPVHLTWAEPLAGGIFLLVICFVVGLVALVGRYRRAASHDRAQLRWIAYGGGVFLGVYLVTFPSSGN